MARQGKAKAEQPVLELDPELSRRHLVKRPRLTRLLDESASRVIVLVAPAGYGKTTLAREWLEDRPHAWYQATDAAADVAVLAAGIADALRSFAPELPTRLRERLRSSDRPEEDLDALVDTLASRPPALPDGAWLVVDDYHLLIGSAAGEELLATLSRDSGFRLLLTTRRRPRWATARRILYGEIFELGQTQLAMSQEEGRTVLAHVARNELPGLLSLAEGWPAVLGLAAMSGTSGPREEDLAATLSDYFAEEVYQSAFAALADDLHHLALIPRLTVGAINSVFGTRAPALIEECGQLGLLTTLQGGELHLHPLLRQFLRHKTEPMKIPSAILDGLCRHYREERAWDDALEAASEAARPGLLVEILEEAYDDLVSEGRLQTLAAWTSEARRRSISAPIVDLASAEVAFRQGLVQKALALAEHAARHFARSHPSAPRAFRLAALAASRCDLFDRAFELYSIAREIAVTTDDQWCAAWGLFTTAVSSESDTAERALTDLLVFDTESPELALDQAAAPYLYGARFGSLAGTLGPMQHAEHFLERSNDPFVRSSFLSFYAHRLVLGGRYDAAAVVAKQHIEEVQPWGIRFALAVGLATRAAAELGRRNLTLALASLDSADAVAATLSGGSRLPMSSAALRARVALARGRARDAVVLLDRDWEQLPEPSMVGEYLATRALALVCSGERAAGAKLADEARETTRGVEARVLAEAAHTIAALATTKRAQAVRRFMDVVAETENVDGFVTAYRAHPPLLALVSSRIRPELRELIHRYDRDLARRVGLAGASATPDSKLSKREREVFALLRRGMTNREIAQALFISESTAKVHVRHILEKLGARSRTEAVAMGLLADVD